VARDRRDCRHRRWRVDVPLAGITALVLLLFIAGWGIVTGGMQIIGAIKLRKEIDNEWFLIAGGVLSVIFGLMLLAQPRAGAQTLIFVIGIYAILDDILQVTFSLRLRKYSQASSVPTRS
jgi:uncharacterized membrane protein HdeD (DUF308 family)